MKNKYTIYFFLLLVLLIGSLSPIFLWEAGPNYIYIYRPLIWLILLTILFLFMPKKSKPFSFKSKAVREIILISALIYIIVYYLLGIAVGFSHSPFDRSFLGILKNSWGILSFLLPREIIRNYFVKNSNKKNLVKTCILITLIMVFTDVSYANFSSSISSVIGIIDFTIKTFLPLLVLNSFLTYLAVKDNYISPLIYILIIKLVSIVTPIFPKESFVLEVIIDLLVPLFAFMKLENIFTRKTNFGIHQENTVGQKIEKGAFVLLLIFLLSFTTRMLPIIPTIIVSNSMLPQIKRGDMVVIKRKEYDNIKINDIIEYKIDDIYVIHRIINIIETSNGKKYITKGDNNRLKDARPVSEEQITGKLILNIPKVGYPTIWLRELLEPEKEVNIEKGVN